MPTELNDYALVIGINDYPNYGSNGRPLKGAIADATAVHSWLKDRTEGGGLPDENCRLIASSAAAGGSLQPHKSEIDDELGELWELSARREKDEGRMPRRFYLFFSGHGQAQQTDDVALCLPSWARNRQSAALSFREYQRLIVDCMGFDEVVLLMDCCRSRRIAARGLESELTCPKPHDRAGGTDIFVAHATEFQTRAFESDVVLPDPDAEPIVHGHFTEALLAALRGGAARDTGGVSASSLLSYLFKLVPRIAKRHGHEQKPKIYPFGIPAQHPDEPVFGTALPIKNGDVKISFTAGRGEVKLEGPDLTLIRQGDGAAGAWDETLPLGTYLLTDMTTGVTRDLRIEATNGVLDVEF